jgi:hypothetical protein
MAIQLLRTSALRAPKATILVYAPARWGKTYLARSCPKPLVITTEKGKTGGLLTLSDMDVPYIHLTDWAEFTPLMAALKKEKGRVSLDGEVFESVIIDSMTGAGELWMQMGMKMMGWSEIWSMEKGKDPRRVYSYVAEKGLQTWKQLLDLEAHLIMTARTTVLEESLGFDERGNEIKQQYEVPELPGQHLPKKITGEFDATLYGEKRGETRVFRTKNQGKRVSGIRVPGGITVPDPILVDMDAIIKLMLGDASMIKRLEMPKPGQKA